MLKKGFIYISILLIFISGALDYKFNLSLIISLILFCMYICIYKKIVFDKGFIVIILYLIMHTTLNIVLKNTTFIYFFKQIIGISTAYLLYKNLLNNENTVDIIKVYLNFVIIFCLIGMFQEIAFIFKIKPLYDLTWLNKAQIVSPTTFGLLRMESIMNEPAHFATAIICATYISIYNILNHKYTDFSKLKSIFVILCTILTFSSVAYIGIFISILLCVKNKKKILSKILIIILIIPMFEIIYNTVDVFKVRVDDTFQSVMGGSIEDKNLSTYALLSNYRVAKVSVTKTLGFGSGLGSHEENYDKYIDSLVDTSKIHIRLNSKDANSLFLRVLSELGILGLMVVLWFIVRFKVNDNGSYEGKISDAILVLFILRLLRQGHYFCDGFWFYIILYMKLYKQYLKNQNITIKNNNIKT